MISLKDFQEASSDYKYVIYVVAPGAVKKVAWSSNTTGDKVNCFEDKDFPDMEKRYQTHVKRARKGLKDIESGKCIVRVIELLTTRSNIPSSTVSSVFNFIFDKWSPEDVLLVFPSWPKSFLPVYHPLNGVNCLKQYKTSRSYTKYQFQPSERLVQDAENYEKRFLGNTNKLAIMLRVERVVEQYLKEVRGSKGNKPKTVKECFQKIHTLKFEMENGTKSLNPLVTLDIGGKYGTGSFRNKTIAALSVKTLEELYGNRWSMEQWEDSFVEAAGGETHTGYIAALQRLLASRADCLVLMGGGDFQALAAQDYLEYHKSGPSCIHLVCCMSYYDEVQRTIKDFA